MNMGMIRGPDSGTLLVRALRTMATDAGYAIHIDSIATRPWSSATFTGARHVVAISTQSVPGLRSWIESLPEAEFALRGHLVAELCVDAIDERSDGARVTLTVLTLVDV